MLIIVADCRIETTSVVNDIQLFQLNTNLMI